jgi:hypothetical protein
LGRAVKPQELFDPALVLFTGRARQMSRLTRPIKPFQELHAPILGIVRADQDNSPQDSENPSFQLVKGLT